MIELSSVAGLRRQKDFIKASGMGWMRTAVPKKHMRWVKDGQPWALDNGKYAADKKKKPWPEQDFLDVLAKVPRTNPPFMAVCPDIVEGGDESLRFSRLWRAKLSDLGYDWLPWYLAVQDNMTEMAVLEELATGRWRGIFVGGSRSFKFQEKPDWPRIAHQLMMGAHLAGIYTPKEQAYARDRGYDSIDSTGWARNDTMEASITAGRAQGTLIRHAMGRLQGWP